MHECENCVEPLLNGDQVERAIIRNLPPIDHHGEIVESIGPNSIRVRLPCKLEFMGAELWQAAAAAYSRGRC